MRRIDLTPYIPGDMRASLELLLTKKRFEHSIGVARTAVFLARKYGCNEKKAAVAGFLHDCTKDMSAAETKLFIKKYRIFIDSQSREIPELIHALTAPYAAKELFKVRDRDILDAIKNHTVGRPDMSVLSRIVYVADYTEYNREYRASAKLRKIIKKSKISLDGLVYSVLKDKLNYLIEGNSRIHSDAILLWNKLTEKI